MLVVKPVATDVDDADHGDGKGLVRYGDAGDEEGDLSRVSAAKDELVDDAVWADGAGDSLEMRVWGVAENEVVTVKGG